MAIVTVDGWEIDEADPSIAYSADTTVSIEKNGDVYFCVDNCAAGTIPRTVIDYLTEAKKKES